MFDTKAFAAGLMKAVQEWINPTIKQIDDRLQEIDATINALPAVRHGKDADPAEVARLVQEAVAALPAPKDGTSVTIEEVAPLVAEEVGKAVAALPEPAKGKDADPELVASLVRDEVAKLPPAEPGKSVTVEEVAPLIAEQVRVAVEALPAPENGKDADPESIAQLVREAIDAVPKPKDGSSVTATDVAPLIAEEVSKAVAAIPAPKDGESVPVEQVQRMVDDAVSKALASVRMPKDGDPGRDAAHIEILPAIDAAKSYPRGTYAKHAGGLWRSYETTTELKGWECIVEGVAQLSIEQHADNPRKFLVNLSTSSGRQEVKEFNMPVVLYRGIFKEGDAYEAGDSVTWGGSTWIALQDTGSKPDSVDGTWRLAVKRGSPGKDAMPVKSGGPAK
ncbi:hypothetical protein J2W28_001001 [Variovorax boronicumulans]|uniref:phage portal protein n=1 Tax=Variovorax boronicumulans TaxID=436515 RepID=UPI002786DF40|nr:phage portal protein [Variovorax boronicumulans]MDP9991973.1 hypothetical protein [Variovorax boronicumulans]MDQ0001868.1 hypothetical protein [Variovorax boronicumulans]